LPLRYYDRIHGHFSTPGRTALHVMLIGVVSDTHGHVPYARDGVRMLESFGVETVLHCGDIGSVEIIPLFAAWPTHFVFGNVDIGAAARELRAAIEQAGQSCHGAFGRLELDGVKIALLHGDDSARLAEAISNQEFDLVCHGHTHLARNELVGRTRVLNPGALFRATPHSVAIVELPALKIEILPS
jgi:putative phosphoesterase